MYGCNLLLIAVTREPLQDGSAHVRVLDGEAYGFVGVIGIEICALETQLVHQQGVLKIKL